MHSCACYDPQVLYAAGSWLVTNNDSLQNPRWLTQASNPLVARLFSMPQLQPTSQQARAGASFASVGGRFAADLNALVEQLREQQTSFIRCVKPNLDKRPRHFDPTYVRSRVRAAGTLAALRFTKRMHLLVVVQLDSLLRLRDEPSVQAQLGSTPPGETAEAFARRLLLACGLSPATFRFGGSASGSGGSGERTLTVASADLLFLSELEGKNGSAADPATVSRVADEVCMCTWHVHGLWAGWLWSRPNMRMPRPCTGGSTDWAGSGRRGCGRKRRGWWR